MNSAIVDIKGALASVAASEAFLGRHADARTLPPLAPDLTPEFTQSRRPAPRRNEMLEAALKNLDTTFHRLADAPGGDFAGIVTRPTVSQNVSRGRC